jgi:predicted PP-loop superfamily ATPase
VAHLEQSPNTDGCVLLFSGGRDSTIAALRLSGVHSPLVLLTVTSSHLIGIDRVRSRIAELRQHLPNCTEWIHAVTTGKDAGAEEGRIESCLPCHDIYLRTAVWIANKRKLRNIAAGYTSYQSDWLEQTPYAIESLKEILSATGKKLLLPASNVTSKDEAKAILNAHQLSIGALEQKCLKQQFNCKDLLPEMARKEIDRWADNLQRLLTTSEAIPVEIKHSLPIGEVEIASIA